jgi:translation elongation factor EF-Tu-like GTPase
MKRDMVKAYRIGEVTGYLARFHVAAVKLDVSLRVGDRIQIIGPLTDFRQTVESMEVQREDVKQGSAGDQAYIPVDQRVCVGDAVVLLPR